MRNSRITVQQAAGAVGAELGGVDLAAPLDDDVIGKIRAALNTHGVVFFRDQQFDTEQHKALARRFGEIFIHPNFKGTGVDPEWW